jgi:hypothetical protein
MSNALTPLSACVTRILSLTGFSKELKTRDIQGAFADCESVNGGFKIKWINDTSLLIVFADATVAKKAYLQTLASPPPVFTSPTADSVVSIKPYDGPDAQAVIQNVNSRHQSNMSRHNSRSSVSAPGVRRNGSQHNNVSGPIPEHPSGTDPVLFIGREPSPTLPSLPSQPTLNSLINSSLGDGVVGSLPTDPAIIASSSFSDGSGTNAAGGPRIGEPGKRMLGHALGVRHPGVSSPSRIPSNTAPGISPGAGADQAMREIQKAMSGVAVAE